MSRFSHCRGRDAHETASLVPYGTDIAISLGMAQLVVRRLDEDVKLKLQNASKASADRAQSLRDQEASMGNFAIAEMVPTAFAARERVWNQLLRIEGN